MRCMIQDATGGALPWEQWKRRLSFKRTAHDSDTVMIT